MINKPTSNSHAAPISRVRRLSALGLAAGLCASIIGFGVASASADAPANIGQAVSAGVSNAAANGINQYASVIDRNTGNLVASSGGDVAVSAASVVKVFTAAYYIASDGPNSSQANDMRTMIIGSVDAIESQYWDCGIVDWAVARYGLSGNTGNSQWSCGGWWGTTKITANDMARFLFAVSKDPAVWPSLSSDMAATANYGADGFNQDFGFKALNGGGSKQGWTDKVNGPDDLSVLGLHSIGFTDRYFAAVLQTGTSYDNMRGTATYAAQLIAAAPIAAVTPARTVGTPPTPYVRLSRADAMRFVSSLHHTALSGTPVANTIPPADVDALVAGQTSKTLVARNASNSINREAVIVDNVFRACLHRSGVGANAFVHGLDAGGSYSWLVSQVCGSRESTLIANTPVKWVQLNFNAQLGRNATAADVSHWTEILRVNGPIRTANILAHTPPATAQTLNWVYQEMLGRSADAGAIAGSSSQMPEQGIFTEPIRIAQSGEFSSHQR